MGSLADFWRKQPDAGSTHSHGTYPIFLEARKTGSALAHPYALYYGHHLDFPCYESTNIPFTGEHSLTWNQPHYARTHHLDDH